MERVGRLLGRPGETRRSSFSALAGLAILSLVLASTAMAQTTVPAGHQDVSIRVVDEDVARDQQQGPPGDDRVEIFQPGMGEPDSLWLKRDGQISGDVFAEAHVATGSIGFPIIAFTFTPNAAVQFQALTRENVGHRIAIVVNNQIISAPVIREPIVSGSGEIDGNFATEEDARAVVAQMMGTDQAGQNRRAIKVDRGKCVTTSSLPAAQKATPLRHATSDVFNKIRHLRTFLSDQPVEKIMKPIGSHPS